MINASRGEDGQNFSRNNTSKLQKVIGQQGNNFNLKL